MSQLPDNSLHTPEELSRSQQPSNCYRTVKRKVNGEDRVAIHAAAGKLPAIVEAFEKARKASSKAEIITFHNVHPRSAQYGRAREKQIPAIGSSETFGG